jgi:hypothetical protein
METINLHDTVYLARPLKSCNRCDVVELKVRTLFDDCFVGAEPTTHQAMMIFYKDSDNRVFHNRSNAVSVAKELEQKIRLENAGKDFGETEYEEY